MLVARTCLRKVDTEDGQSEQVVSLSDLRDMRAYVLLGDPGSGKSTAFWQEASASAGQFVSASEFRAFDFPEWTDLQEPLFIDGLDETRAGGSNGSQPLLEIRAKLQRLRIHKFRLSCRASDWLGTPDLEKLQGIRPEETMTVVTLRPLTVEDVSTLLSTVHAISDAPAFIESAKRHGVTELLFNPQNLLMLAKAVGPKNRWPDTKLEVYRLACERLVQEHNEEHWAASRKTSPSDESLLQAAGYLSAVQLIAEVRGFTYRREGPERVVTVNALPNPHGWPLREVLGSRLFSSLGDDVFAPIHRTLAEFLAARSVSDQLQQRLTVRRALALFTGHDGSIVSGMQGIGGWLAAHSVRARPSLCRIDPLSVLIHGDATHFTVEQKTSLTRDIGREIAESPSFRWRDQHRQGFFALVTPEMASVVQAEIAHESRASEQQYLVMALLQGLGNTTPSTPIAAALWIVARDSTRWSVVRRDALRLALDHSTDSGAKARALLEDIRTGAVADDDDELLGMLLESMFPTTLAAGELVMHLHRPKRRYFIGTYAMFWRRTLLLNWPEHDAAILDGLTARTDLREPPVFTEYKALIGSLLSKIFQLEANAIDDDRLLDWLDLACDPRGTSLIDRSHQLVISSWLEAHPARYLSLLALSLDRYMGDGLRIWRAEARFVGAQPPQRMLRWWLERSETCAAPERAAALFARALLEIESEIGPDLDAALTDCSRIADARGWQETLERGLSCPWAADDWRYEEAEGKRQAERRSRDRINFLRARLPQMRQRPVPTRLLSYLASVYEGRNFYAEGHTPEDRLHTLFGGDQSLVAAAIAALQSTAEYCEWPTADTILGASAQRQESWLHAAMQISIEMNHRDNPEFISQLDAGRLHSALVGHFVRSVEGHESWAVAASSDRPECVAQALKTYVSAINQWPTLQPSIGHLILDPDFAKVTTGWLLDLLPLLPPRASESLQRDVEHALSQALSHPDQLGVQALIKQRLAIPRLDPCQRSWCLAVGIVLNPSEHFTCAARYLERRPLAKERIGRFIANWLDKKGEAHRLEAGAIGLLIEHLGADCPPRYLPGPGFVSTEMKLAELVKRLIDELSGRADGASGEQLERLAPLPKLTAWHPRLREARAAQAVVRRDAMYQHPTWQQVAATLNLGPPASASEVAAIVADEVDALAADIHDGDFSQSQLFWTAPNDTEPRRPLWEERCRDLFSAELRIRLERFGIDCLPESRHADDKRSDLLCTAGPTVAVPIEMKRDEHPELWTAIRGQLVPRYVRDPRAGGRGLYLVFWFGERPTIRIPPQGTRPQTAAEMKTMLEANLSEAERLVITVHVVDCSIPSER